MKQTQTELQEQLHQTFFYDPDTGLLARRRGDDAQPVANRYQRFQGMSCAANRLIWAYMTGHWPAFPVYHRDRDPRNYRWNNLACAEGALPEVPDDGLTPLQRRVRAKFAYDPETGHFGIRSDQPWLAQRSRREPGKPGKPDYYRKARFEGKSVRVHRLIWVYMTGAWPQDQIDHIDRDRHNNRWANLREADAYVNNQNRRGVNPETPGVFKLKEGTYKIFTPLPMVFASADSAVRARQVLRSAPPASRGLLKGVYLSLPRNIYLTFDDERPYAAMRNGEPIGEFADLWSACEALCERTGRDQLRRRGVRPSALEF